MSTSSVGISTASSSPAVAEALEDSQSDESQVLDDADTELSSVSEPVGTKVQKEPRNTARGARATSLAQSMVCAVRDSLYSYAQRAVIKTLEAGPQPAHIAFIMDGNRRWSRQRGFHVQQGHQMGFEALKRVLELCMGMEGIRMVTVYAFAIDNFKRDPAEVDALMSIARSRLLQLIGHGEVVSRYAVRVRVVGRRELLPHEVREAIERIEHTTQHNSRRVLNICMPYSAQDEICRAVTTRVQRKKPLTTPADLDDELMVSGSMPVDILVRTSNVSRLSDFLLWQCNERTQLHFIDRFWPQFGLWDLVPIILAYQRDRLAEESRAMLR